MTLWIALGALSLLAVLFVVWPIYKHTRRVSMLLVAPIIFLVALSSGLYYSIGSPSVPSGAGSAPDINEMVSSLAARLESEPNDVNGWLMLGRTHATLEDYPASISAYEKAMALENAQNAQTLVSLALVLIEQNEGAIDGRATGLLENALALEPNNENALFYSGFAAASRGETLLAADRWEILLGLNAPAEIRDLLQGRINEWRGVEPTPVQAVPVEQVGIILAANVSVSEEALAALPETASVFIIARDPQQPSPPIAVTRRQLDELPTKIELSDKDSMVPGRSLSNFAEFELLARVSVSGNPIAQAGDWYGIKTVSKGDEVVDLVVDTAVE